MDTGSLVQYQFDKFIDQNMMQCASYTPQPRQEEFFQPYERQSIMTVNRPNLLDVRIQKFRQKVQQSIKNKCLSRLSKKRHEKINKYRTEILHQNPNFSKLIQGQSLKSVDQQENQQQVYDYQSYQPNENNKQINQHVYNEIVSEDVVNEIMHDELNNQQELTVDQFNEEYIQLYNELNQYLARKLLESCRNDEALNYEKNNEFSKIQAELIAETYDPNNNSFYICALCKRYVYRLGNGKVRCEKPGCLDIDLRCDDFKLEDLMHMIMKVLIDHQQNQEGQGNECCSVEKHIKVKVALMSECGLEQLCEEDGDSLAIFVTCDNCSFFDFVSLN